MHPSVMTALAAGATLVTANQRLARHLAAEYGGLMAREAPVWEAPDILPWPQWLERFWQDSFGLLDGDRPQVLLSGVQELTLWERVIRESEASELLQVPAAARAAREAWQLLYAWRLPLARAAEYGNEDATAFGRWAAAYRQYVSGHASLDSATLPDAVARAFAHGRVRRPAVLLLAGFDELTPQQQSVLDTLRAADGHIDVVPLPEREPRGARLACIDGRTELRAAAAWARARLEAGAHRIGIAVPDLAAQRPALMRELDEALVPRALVVAPGGDAVRPYNLSLGEPLADVPVVRAALAILEAGRDTRMPLALASALVRSPYLGGYADEADARARFDAALRRRGEDSIGAHGLMREAQQAGASVPRLAAQLLAWRDRLPAPRQRLAPSAWSELFARLLAAIGWPGEAAPDHEQLRARESWRDLLGDLAAQDTLAPRLNYGEALALARRLALERVFQPPTPATPVQVLGLLETAGLEFDCLWVLGLDDETWPPSPRPNPFLPHALQRAGHMPHASAERELEFAHRLTERLMRSADEVVFSHADTAGDEARRVSPLLQVLPELRADDLPHPAEGIAERQYVARAIESCIDRQAPPLPAGARASGGTKLLQLQAACPFRAFAELRLGARTPDDPEPGLDASARGQLVHEALKHLWRSVQSHERLCALTPAGLDAAIESAVGQALEQRAGVRAHTLEGRFRAIEARRLQDLLREWLALEKERAPFRVIGAELARSIELGGLTLDARLDRLDELADGSAVIMDYKTGRPSPQRWEGERPDEPQLPAYALSVRTERPVAALLFAQLRPGEPAFRGRAADEGIAPKIKPGKSDPPWPDRLDQWQATLTGLAEAFRAGDARVDPKRFPATCEHCGLSALCRVHEQGIVPRDEDDGDE